MDELQCKYCVVEDVTPWHGDVYDHPDHKFVCSATGKEILPYHCCSKNCKKYEQKEG